MASGRLSSKPFPGAWAGEGSVLGPQEGRAVSHGVWDCTPSGGAVPGAGQTVRHPAWLELASMCGLESLSACLGPWVPPF